MQMRAVEERLHGPDVRAVNSKRRVSERLEMAGTTLPSAHPGSIGLLLQSCRQTVGLKATFGRTPRPTRGAGCIASTILLADPAITPTRRWYDERVEDLQRRSSFAAARPATVQHVGLEIPDVEVLAVGRDVRP